MRDDKQPVVEREAAYERPVLTRHGSFDRVTAGRLGRPGEPGGGWFGF